MALRDPVAAYTAASNLEAHLICNLLIEAGVPAVAVDDVSQVGTWMFGLVSQFHKPQIWVERDDVARAKVVIGEYERRAAERRNPDRAGTPIDVICEECGKRTSFPASMKESVQSCPHCGAYVDVGDELSFDEWDEMPADEPEKDDEEG